MSQVPLLLLRQRRRTSSSCTGLGLALCSLGLISYRRGQYLPVTKTLPVASSYAMPAAAPAPLADNVPPCKQNLYNAGIVAKDGLIVAVYGTRVDAHHSEHPWGRFVGCSEPSEQCAAVQVESRPCMHCIPPFSREGQHRASTPKSNSRLHYQKHTVI